MKWFVTAIISLSIVFNLLAKNNKHENILKYNCLLTTSGWHTFNVHSTFRDEKMKQRIFRYLGRFYIFITVLMALTIEIHDLNDDARIFFLFQVTTVKDFLSLFTQLSCSTVYTYLCTDYFSSWRINGKRCFSITLISKS